MSDHDLMEMPEWLELICRSKAAQVRGWSDEELAAELERLCIEQK